MNYESLKLQLFHFFYLEGSWDSRPYPEESSYLLLGLKDKTWARFLS